MSLVLNGGDGALGAPVDFLREGHVGGGDEGGTDNVRGQLGRVVEAVHGLGELVVEKIAVVVHLEPVAVLALMSPRKQRLRT